MEAKINGWWKYEAEGEETPWIQEEVVEKLIAYNPFADFPEKSRSDVSRGSFSCDGNEPTLVSACCFLWVSGARNANSVKIMNAILGDVKIGHDPDFSAIPGFKAWASELFDVGQEAEQEATASGRTPSLVLLGPPPPPASPGRVPALIDVNSQPNTSSTRHKYGKPCVEWTCSMCFMNNSAISVCNFCTMSWMCAQSDCETVNISYPGLLCQECSAECPIPLELSNGADWFSLPPSKSWKASKNHYKMKDPVDPWTDAGSTGDVAAGARSGLKKLSKAPPRTPLKKRRRKDAIGAAWTARAVAVGA